MDIDLIRKIAREAADLMQTEEEEGRRAAALEFAISALGTGLAAQYYVDAARQIEAYLKGGEPAVDNVKPFLTQTN